MTVPELDAAARTEVAADEIARAWSRVQLARHPGRPRTLDLVPHLFDDFVELHGDRAFRDDPAIVGGPALLEGRPVMVIGHQKGTDTESNIARNFGMPHPDGFRKARRLMRLADKLGMPIVTLVDTPGAFPGPAAEERGQAEAIAASIKEMTGLRVPVVAVIVGEGGSGGALAIGVGDVVLALENAVYSVISPEGCAAILWRSAEEAPRAAAAMRMTAADQLEQGVIDRVIEEPDGGAHEDLPATARAIRREVVAALRRIDQVPDGELVARRYARLRGIGSFREAAPLEAAGGEGASFSQRIGRLLQSVPGRRPRWSEVWPGGPDDADTEEER